MGIRDKFPISVACFVESSGNLWSYWCNSGRIVLKSTEPSPAQIRTGNSTLSHCNDKTGAKWVEKLQIMGLQKEGRNQSRLSEKLVENESKVGRKLVKSSYRLAFPRWSPCLMRLDTCTLATLAWKSSCHHVIMRSILGWMLNVPWMAPDDEPQWENDIKNVCFARPFANYRMEDECCVKSIWMIYFCSTTELMCLYDVRIIRRRRHRRTSLSATSTAYGRIARLEINTGFSIENPSLWV